MQMYPRHDFLMEAVRADFEAIYWYDLASLTFWRRNASAHLHQAIAIHKTWYGFALRLGKRGGSGHAASSKP